jgi:hypothetical protein
VDIKTHSFIHSSEPDSDDVNMTEDSEEMQQGYLCTSEDPRRIGVGGDETIILNSRELRKAITLQPQTIKHYG